MADDKQGDDLEKWKRTNVRIVHPERLATHLSGRKSLALEVGKEEARSAAKQAVDQTDHGSLADYATVACDQALIGNVGEFKAVLKSILAMPLYDVREVSILELGEMFARLWRAAECLGENEDLKHDLADRIVMAGIAWDEFFEPFRKEVKPVSDVYVYTCRVEQSLDHRWTSWPGRLVFEASWMSHVTSWRVYARNENEAKALLFPWLQRCYPKASVFLAVERGVGPFHESVGVISQGVRAGR
jgi:hypothetical protein